MESGVKAETVWAVAVFMHDAVKGLGEGAFDLEDLDEEFERLQQAIRPNSTTGMPILVVNSPMGPIGKRLFLWHTGPLRPRHVAKTRILTQDSTNAMLRSLHVKLGSFEPSDEKHTDM